MLCRDSNCYQFFTDAGVNLLAFKAVPTGSNRTCFSLFPDDSSKMIDGAKQAGLSLDDPRKALIVKGYDDQADECANVHEMLARADIKVYESSGIANIKGSYGVVLYIDNKDIEKVRMALDI